MEQISIREYARRLGVSDTAIRKARDAGKIAEGFDPETGKVIPAIADQEWGNDQRAVKRRSGLSSKARMKRLNAGIADEWGYDYKRCDVFTGMNAKELLDSIHISASHSRQEAIRLREIIGAGLDIIKLAEAEGKLVPRDKVEKVLFSLGSELKKALLNIPQRVVRDLMAATNEVEAANILTDEFMAVLSTYGNLKPDALR